MSDPPSKPRRILGRIVLAALTVLLLITITLSWYVKTDSFRMLVNRRLISSLEKITGGRVELGKFTVVPFRFRVEVHDLTIHGTEPAGEAPWVHVDNTVAEIKIISVFESEYGFDSLTLDHPVVHIIVYPDGTANQPAPKINRAASEKTPIEQFFSLSVGRLEVLRGELQWDNQRIPLDFVAYDVTTQMNYSFFSRRYDSHVRVGKFDTKLQDLRPFSSMSRAQFALAQDHVEVQSFEWASGRSRLEASGRIDNFHDPKFTGTYNVRMDLADAGSTLRMRGLRAGTVEFGGKGTYSSSDLLASGKVLLKDVEWRDDSLALHNANLSSQYDLNRTHLKLSGLQARLLGGSAAGELEVENWLGTAAAKGKNRTAGLQKGALNLKVKNVSVSALAASLSTRQLPLERLRLAGSASGTLEAGWVRDPRDADLTFKFDLAPPSVLSPNEIPLTASTAGIYRGSAEELEISNLNLATRSTQIRAVGKLSSSTSLRLSASTADLSEWQPMVSALRGPQIPLKVAGHAAFTGTATGKLSDITLTGRLQMNDFYNLLPSPPGTPERQVHWDSLLADIQISSRIASVRNATLRRGPATIVFEGSAGLRAGQFAGWSPFTARLELHSAEIAELMPLAGYSYPVTGNLELSLNASGTKLDPHGEGQFQLTAGSLFGQPVSRAAGDLRLSGGELQLNNISLAYLDATIRGSAAYNPNDRTFRFSLAGANFDLARLPQLQKSRIAIGGAMEVTAQGSGSLDAPVINAKVQIHDLILGRERVGDFTFNAVTHGTEVEVIGRSNFEKADLSVDGIVHLQGDWPADLALRFDQLDIDSVLQAYLPNVVTGHSSASGSVQLRGPLRQPRELTVAGELSKLLVNVENISAQNQGPVRFSFTGQVLTLDQFHLEGEGTDLTARGTVQTAGDHELDLRADGHLNLKLLQSFSPDLTASGIVTIAVNVAGTYSHPALQGKVDVAKGAIASNNLPNGLSELNGTLLFNQDQLQIQSLTTRVGGGNINLTGYIGYTPHLNFNISAHGEDVRLRPAGMSATADASLRLTGTPADAAITGDVVVTKLNVTPGFDFARYLESTKQTLGPTQGNSLLSKIRLDVHVLTTPELQMQSSLAKLSGDADLHLRGTMVRPTVLGHVHTMEGDVYFSGTKYSLERGEITFTGSGLQPTLDLQATTRVRDYDITLGVNGTPDKLNFTYRSEPPLPTSDIVALLALGRTQSTSATLSGSSQGAFSQEASNVILSQALNATLSNRAQRLFGISRIKVDPQGLNTETSPTRTSPAVTIEQQVSNNLTLTYTTEVAQASQQVIQGEYNVTRNISILAVRDQNGVVSFDVRLRQRRK